MISPSQGVQNTYTPPSQMALEREKEEERSLPLLDEAKAVLLDLQLDIPKLIHDQLNPLIMGALDRYVTDLAKESWGGSVLTSSYALFRSSIASWIEQTVQTIFSNLLEASQEHFKETEIKDPLFQLVLLAAKIAKDDLELIQAKLDEGTRAKHFLLNELEPQLSELKKMLKESEKIEGEETDYLESPPDAKYLREKIRLLESDKEKLMKEIAVIYQPICQTLLKIACKNGAEDLKFPNIRIPLLFDLKQYAFGLIQFYASYALASLAAKMVSTSSLKNQKNIDEIKKHPNGATELIELIKLTGKQFNEVISNQLSQPGESVGHNSPLERKLWELVQKLGGQEDQNVEYLLKQIGGYCEPILTHIFAHLLKEMPLDDGRHVLTYIFETYLKTICSEQEFAKFEATVADIQRRFPDDQVLSVEQQQQKANELKEAYQFFERQAMAVLDKAGLNAQGLNELLPYGGDQVVAFVKPIAVNFLGEYYRDVICFQHKLSPETHPMSTKFAEFEQSYLTVDAFVEALLPSVRGTLRDPESFMGKTMIVTVQKFLLVKEVPASRQFFNQPIKELCETPVFDKVEGFVKGYIRDSLLLFLGNLATHRAGFKPGKSRLEQDGFLQLMHILRESMDPATLKAKLGQWKAMPEVTEEDKKAKDRARKELFATCISRLMLEGGLKNDRHLICPAGKKEKMRQIFEETILPEILLYASEFILSALPPETLPPQITARYAQMKGRYRLEYLGEKVCEKAISMAPKHFKEKGHVIAQVLMGRTSLPTAQEILLGQSLSGILENPAIQKQFFSYITGSLESTVQYVLQNLAARGPIEEGDALTNILLLIKQRMADNKHGIAPILAKKMAKYGRQTKQLREGKKELKELREEARKLLIENPRLKESPVDDPKRVRFGELEDLIKICEKQCADEEKKRDCKAQERQFAEVFEPFIAQLIDDMGLSDMPWKKNVVAMVADQVVAAYVDLDGPSSTRKKHEKNLKPELRGAVKTLVSHGLQLGQDYFIQNTGSLANTFGEFFDPELKQPLLGAKNPRLASGGEQELLIALVQGELYGQVIEILDSLFSNLKKVEEKDPKVMTHMVFEFMARFTAHLKGKENTERTALEMDQFYRDLSVWILKMAGKEKASDLSISSAYQEMIWEELNNKLPKLLKNSFEQHLRRQSLERMVEQFVTNFNAQLDAYRLKEKSSEKTPNAAPPNTTSVAEDKQKIVDLLQQLHAALPGSNILLLLNMPLIQSMSAEAIEKALKSTIAQMGNLPSAILEKVIIDAAQNLQKKGVEPAKVPPTWKKVIFDFFFGWLIAGLFWGLKRDVGHAANTVKKQLDELKVKQVVIGSLEAVLKS